MDRFTWFIAFIFVSNLLMDLPKVAAQAETDAENIIIPEGKFSAQSVRPTILNEQQKEAPTEGAQQVNHRIGTNPKESVEFIDGTTPDPTAGRSQNTFFPTQDGRIPFFDNIFNIPIATLQAVNNLVQSIIG